MARTSSTVNWWRLWCEPSRSEVSVTRTSNVSENTLGSNRNLLTHANSGRGHDVQVAGVRRQEVAGPAYLEKHRDPAQVELRLGQQAVTRHVRGHVGDHRHDRLRHGGLVRIRWYRAENRVTH